MVEVLTEEEKKADFDARRDAAIQEMDAVLQKHEVGIKLALTGWPVAIAPTIHYVDKKVYDQDLNRKERRTRDSKARKQR